MLAERSQILVLRRAAGPHDAASARLDDAGTVLGAPLAGKQKALIGAFRDHALNVAFACGLALLDAFVEHLEHAAGLLARLARALDDDLISVGVSRDAERALDARDVLIVMAEDYGRGGVVGESDGDFRRFGFREASDG